MNNEDLLKRVEALEARQAPQLGDFGELIGEIMVCFRVRIQAAFARVQFFLGSLQSQPEIAPTGLFRLQASFKRVTFLPACEKLSEAKAEVYNLKRCGVFGTATGTTLDLQNTVATLKAQNAHLDVRTTAKIGELTTERDALVAKVKQLEADAEFAKKAHAVVCAECDNLNQECDQLIDACRTTMWIPLSERKPTEEDGIDTGFMGAYRQVAWLNGSLPYIADWDHQPEDATHWCRLPALPEIQVEVADTGEKKYRTLVPGEVVQEGDEFYNGVEWSPVKYPGKILPENGLKRDRAETYYVIVPPVRRQVS